MKGTRALVRAATPRNGTQVEVPGPGPRRGVQKDC